MKDTRANPSLCSVVRTILSWKGTEGQCLAALHSHISTLEPDQLTLPLTRDVSVKVLAGGPTGLYIVHECTRERQGRARLDLLIRRRTPINPTLRA